MRFANLKRFTAVLITLSLAVCSTNIDEAFEKTDEFRVQVYISGKQLREYKIQRGWSLTPADYAPGIVVSGEGYVFNFNGETVVVNKPDGQYSKDINSEEYEFFIKDTL